MPVRTANDLASAVKLFRAYASSLEIDLSYQDCGGSGFLDSGIS
jgi:hypothetical protein